MPLLAIVTSSTVATIKSFFKFHLIAQIKEIFIEGGTNGDAWSGVPPIRVPMLREPLLLDLAIVGHKTSVRIFAPLLANERTKTLKVFDASLVANI